MGSIKNLEDLEAWQVAREFANKIYDLTASFPKDEKYNIVRHMRESSRSVMGIIAEGFGRFFFKDSARFYSDARGSLFEVRSDLYLSFDRKYINKQTLIDCLKDADRLGRLINGLISSSYRSAEKYKKTQVKKGE